MTRPQICSTNLLKVWTRRSVILLCDGMAEIPCGFVVGLKLVYCDAK